MARPTTTVLLLLLLIGAADFSLAQTNKSNPPPKFGASGQISPSQFSNSVYNLSTLGQNNQNSVSLFAKTMAQPVNTFVISTDLGADIRKNFKDGEVGLKQYIDQVYHALNILKDKPEDKTVSMTIRELAAFLNQSGKRTPILVTGYVKVVEAHKMEYSESFMQIVLKMMEPLLVQELNQYLTANPPSGMSETTAVEKKRGALRTAFPNAFDPPDFSRPPIQKTQESYQETPRETLAFSLLDTFDAHSNLLIPTLLYSNRPRGFDAGFQLYAGRLSHPSDDLAFDQADGFGLRLQVDLNPSITRPYEQRLAANSHVAATLSQSVIDSPVVTQNHWTKTRNLDGLAKILTEIFGKNDFDKDKLLFHDIGPNFVDDRIKLNRGPRKANYALTALENGDVRSDIDAVGQAYRRAVTSWRPFGVFGYQHVNRLGAAADAGIVLSKLVPFRLPTPSVGLSLLLEGQAVQFTPRMSREVSAARLRIAAALRDGIPYADRDADQLAPREHTGTWRWMLGTEYSSNNVVDGGDAYHFFCRVRTSHYTDVGLIYGKRADHKDFWGLNITTFLAFPHRRKSGK